MINYVFSSQKDRSSKTRVSSDMLFSMHYSKLNFQMIMKRKINVKINYFFLTTWILLFKEPFRRCLYLSDALLRCPEQKCFHHIRCHKSKGNHFDFLVIFLSKCLFLKQIAMCFTVRSNHQPPEDQTWHLGCWVLHVIQHNLWKMHPGQPRISRHIPVCHTVH